jgi:hypothetical protein
VVLREEQLLLVRSPAAERFQLVEQLLLLADLAPEPFRDRVLERIPALRREAEVRGNETLELQQRLLVEDDRVEVLELEVGVLEAPLRGVVRKARILLLAREPRRCRERGGSSLRLHVLRVDDPPMLMPVRVRLVVGAQAEPALPQRPRGHSKRGDQPVEERAGAASARLHAPALRARKVKKPGK